MANSKYQIAFEDRLSSLHAKIETYHAAGNDSIEALLAKKVTLENISTDISDALQGAYRKVIKRIKNLSHRLKKLTTKYGQWVEDVSLHEEFVRRLATQLRSLEYEVDDLAHAHSPRLAGVEIVANLKLYELNRAEEQLDRMKQACTRSGKALEKLIERSPSPREEEESYRNLFESSQRLVGRVESLLDGVIRESARRSRREGDEEQGAE